MAHSHSDSMTNGKKKALLIAIENNTVGGFHQLHHAQHDAQKLRLLLIEVFGYSEDNIVLMMVHESVPESLLPTKKNIRRQLQFLVQGVSAGDHRFFYYSGHGHQVPCEHHTESDGLDEEIYTCNGEEIIDNDLKKWLVNPLPRGCKLFALLDSCHSQTMLDLDHYHCNDVAGRSSPLPMLWKARPKCLRRKAIRPSPSHAFTIASHERRGRPASRTPSLITAVSVGSSPSLCKWVPLSMELHRVISPCSIFPCDGKCPLPNGDSDRAHVISLAACKDSENAFDDRLYGTTVTKLFVDHLRANPKSTLRALLLAISQRVEEMTAARRVWDKETRVASRRPTFTTSPRITGWTPRPARRKTIDVCSLEEFFQSTSSGRDKDENEYSQKPNYSSHYPLNLDELVDL